MARVRRRQQPRLDEVAVGNCPGPPAQPARLEPHGPEEREMEYCITLPPAQRDPARLEDALLGADPAAIFDVDPLHVIRVATTLGPAELSALLDTLGGHFCDTQVRLLSSD